MDEELRKRRTHYCLEQIAIDFLVFSIRFKHKQRGHFTPSEGYFINNCAFHIDTVKTICIVMKINKNEYQVKMGVSINLVIMSADKERRKWRAVTFNISDILTSPLLKKSTWMV